MAFSDLFNKGFCSNSNILGAGLGTCQFNLSRINTIWVHDYNYQFPINFEPSVQNYMQLVRKEEMRVFQGAVNATWETAEDGTQTFAGGAKRTTDKMPYEFTVFFPQDINFDRALRAVENKQRLSITLIDDKGQIANFIDADGIVTPMNVSFFQVAPYKPSGDDAAGTMVRIQIENRKAFDTQFSIMDQKAYNFDPSKVVDVIDTTFTVQADTTTKFDFKVKRDADKHAQSGITIGLLRVRQNNTVIPNNILTLVENGGAGSGEYSITRSSGTFTQNVPIEVNFYDSNTNTNTAFISGVLLKGVCSGF